MDAIRNTRCSVILSSDSVIILCFSCATVAVLPRIELDYDY